MSRIFKLKKYWISTLCLLLFSLTTVAQEYSDETIGFDLVKETAILKKYGVTDPNMAKEIALIRKMCTRRYLAIEKINKTILQNIHPTAQKSAKLTARSTAVTVADIPQTERDVLQAFYNIATNKSNLKGWNFSNPVTSWNSQNGTGWNGVTIVDGHVTKLIFEYGIDLNGNIPSNIAQLSQLKNLSIINNKNINGSIPPGIVGLTNLETLDLYQTKLTGTLPSNIGLMSALKFLRLSNNLMTGSIPTSIGQLSELRALEITNSQLSGTIPTEISLLTKLQSIALYATGINGEIPQGIFQLHDLEFIAFAGGTGYIPPSIGQLTKLQYLDLGISKIRGTLPAELGLLSELTYLSINNSPELTGTIPSGIFQLQNLIELFMVGCPNLTGSLPNSVNQPNIQSIYLNNNNLTGSVPVFNCPNLGEIYLSNNKFSSVSPQFGQGTAPIGTINLSYNKFSGAAPASLFQLQSLHEVYLNNNELSGPLPVNIGNVNILDLSYNKFTGSIPLFSNIANLTNVFLNNNLLSGNISSQIAFGFTSNLSELRIESNKFTFADIMNLMQQHIVPGLTYSPQLKVGQPKTINTANPIVPLSIDYDNPTPDDTFQWYKGISPNGVLINYPGMTSTGPRLVLEDVESSDSGYYYCVVKNPLLGGGGPGQQLVLESEPILLNVLCRPQTTGTLNITSEDFLIGRPVNFSFDTSTPNVYFKWSFYDLNGVVTGSTVLSSSTVSKSYNLPGTYKIKLEAIQNNCTTTIEKTFTVVSCIPITGAIKVTKTTSYPFQFSNPGSISAIACSETAFPVKFYASTQTLNIGTQLYTNEGLTSAVTNGISWYQNQTNATSYKIDASGKITETFSCSSPIGYAFRFSSPGRPTSSEVCSQTGFPDTFYAASSSLGIGTQLYLDQNLKTRVGSGNLWRKEGINGLTYRIDNDGKVAETSSCTPVLQSYWYKADDPVVSPQQDYVVYISEDGDERTAYLSREESGNPCQEIIARRIVRAIRVSPCTP
ncbi:leucine-rich repeat domain-containing protein [Flavobacterium sp. FlaQc-48]|uniref:leucine-rich repeat domain-containing protein n=1 Tax=Flavobacterium sp. FlaQc-48 TaxID=3374181 RepID=UPI003757C8B2